MSSTSVRLFSHVTIAAGGNAVGPAGGLGLDLTGFNDFRLLFHFTGPAGTKIIINEYCGPVGGIDQINFDIANVALDALGNLTYRSKFDIYQPKLFAIRVFNNGTGPLKLDGSLYAAE